MISKSKIRLQEFANLKEKYPVLKDVKPLAIGFYDQLYLATNDAKLCRSYLGKLMQSYGYLKSFVIYENRYNLDGSISSDLTSEHREYASTKVNERLLIIAEKDAKKKKAKLLLKSTAKRLQEKLPNVPVVQAGKVPNMGLSGVVPVVQVAKPNVVISVKKHRVIKLPS